MQSIVRVLCDTERCQAPLVSSSVAGAMAGSRVKGRSPGAKQASDMPGDLPYSPRALMENAAMAALSDWRSFWDGEHSIYVNARHKDVHYRDIAEAIVSYLPSPQARVLDFGCGEATHADKVAAVAGEVLLCESAASVRASMAARFAGNPRIKICAPEELEARASGSLDLIVANSVVQYLSSAELERLLALWKRLLTPGGTLIVADIIP